MILLKICTVVVSKISKNGIKILVHSFHASYVVALFSIQSNVHNAQTWFAKDVSIQNLSKTSRGANMIRTDMNVSRGVAQPSSNYNSKQKNKAY